MSYHWKPSSADRQAYADACREIEAKGLKLSKSHGAYRYTAKKTEKTPEYQITNYQAIITKTLKMK